ATSVKVGYCQACIQKPPLEQFSGGFALRERKIHAQHQIKNNTNTNINFKTSQHRDTEEAQRALRKARTAKTGELLCFYSGARPSGYQPTTLLRQHGSLQPG
ncbi:hypothetical protein ACO0LM_25595, partial [Undibacterium sp. Di26W]|uniref:hypothetical protein n=1 Tax=Undibacterium sp. Di26W TaxID=3413035 RepID=UPI003BF0AEF3